MNYKITLREAVGDFLKKEVKINDFQVVVEEEEVEDQTNSKYNDLDDAMFDMDIKIGGK